MIQEVKPNTNKIDSQIHQDWIHEVSTLHRHAIGLPHEPSKWFAKDITKFTELNTNSLEQWIAIAKKVIRSARRKMRNDKQHRLTKFYPLQLTPKNNNRTIEASNPPKSNKKQPSIITFLQSTKTNEMKGRLDLNQRNNTTTHFENRTIVINNLSPTSNPSPETN